MTRPFTPHDPPVPGHAPRRLSDRSFGVLLAGALLVATFFPLVLGHDARLWLAPAPAVVLVVAVGAPGLLRRPHRLWLFGAGLLNRVVNPVLIAIVFFGTITPIAWAMRAFRRDALRLRLDPAAETYWEPRGARPLDHLENQF